MKKIYAVILVMSIVLTGCASFPDLSERESDMISQYIVGSVLNYSQGYKYAFTYDRTVLTPTPPPAPTQAPAPSMKPSTPSNVNQSGSSNKPTMKDVSLSEIYGIAGINVFPVSVKATKDIVTEFSSVSAYPGKKLILVSFRIKNSSSKAQNVNLVSKNIRYSLTMDGKSCGQAQLTILEGDMLGFNEKIAAGKSASGVLVFQADASAKVKKAEIEVTSGNEKSVVNIK